MKNIRVIGGYKCGCFYGPVWIKDRLEYCGVHGADIANEYDVSFMSAPNKVLHADVCPVSNGEHVWEPDGSAPHECCSLCGTRR